MARIILYILTSILLVYVQSCTGTIDKDGKNDDSLKCTIQLGGICIDPKDTAQKAVLTIAVGLFTKIDDKLFQQAVDKILNIYNQNPKITASLGLVLSIVILKDSINDYEKIAIYNQQIINALENKDEDMRLKNLKLIKMLLIADQKQQFTMAVIKGSFAIGFGYIAYSMIGSWLFWPMAGAATCTGTATLINAYNYREFSMLLTKLKHDGHLD